MGLFPDFLLPDAMKYYQEMNKMYEKNPYVIDTTPPMAGHVRKYKSHEWHNKVDKLFSPDRIPEYVEKGLITVRYHPQHEGLRILNYTAKVQYMNAWDEVTKNCRGLVIDKDNRIIARPYAKFHNLEEHIDKSFLLDARCTSVQDKMDGSLGILVCYEGDIFIATRGSFVSEQALKATEILHEKHKLFIDRITDYKIYSELPTSITYLFEIIYPENRIVVNYGDVEDLVLLGALNINNGWSKFPHKDLEHWDGHRVQEFLDAPISNAGSAWESIKNMRNDDGTCEGYVLTFDGKGSDADFRVKIKYDEYKRLHHLLTNISEKKIWECLMGGEPLLNLLEHVPDEYYQWVKSVQDRLLQQFEEIDATHWEMFQQIKKRLGDAPRKEYAEEFQRLAKHPSILFCMLDGKDYSEYIYRIIKPVTAEVFHEDSEDI